MDINRARGLVSTYMNAPSVKQADDFMKENSAWYWMARGFIEAYDSQQAIIDKQREEIERLRSSLLNYRKQSPETTTILNGEGLK